MHSADVRQLAICKQKGVPITPDSVILDFGCADGHRTYQLRDLGYRHAFGYNKDNYMNQANPVRVRQEADREWFRFSGDGVLPWPDGTFDLILSEQVFEHVLDQEMAFREIYRVLKAGGVCINVLPAKWHLIEPHLKVPLGGYKPFKFWAWYYLWAVLGVRHAYQKGKSSAVVAQRNLTYATESLNYLSCRQYHRLLGQFAWTLSWEELAYMQASYKPRIQRFARVAAAIPLLSSLVRTFVNRVMFLQKPTN